MVEAHHKLVKTTPKPRATKNSSGELGPEPPPLEPLAVGDGAEPDVVVADILDEILR
jgi:hypothetical protein